LALQKAAQAQSTADGKSTTYLIQPTSYKLGDMWVLAADQTVNGIAYKSGEILTATQDSTSYNQSHWVKKVRYTDDTAVDNLQIGGRNLINGDTKLIERTGIGWTHIPLSKQLVEGKTYILGGEFRIDSGTGGLIGLNDGNCSANFIAIPKNTPFVASAAMSALTHFAVAKITGASDLIVSAKEAKLEEGNKKTAWTQSPEYVQFKIDEAVVKATYWSVKASAPVIYKDAINAATAGSHTSVTVSGELRSGTTTTAGGFLTVTPNGGTESGTASASPVTIAPANGDGKTSYTVRLYDTAAKTTLLDTQTIPVVFKGASGINAINVVLSNEADVLPASTDGTVSDYSGSGTEIRVFEGATELSYGTSNGQYQVSAVGSGITVGTPSTSGNRRVYGVASNMTSDNATITFTITGKTASGTSFSLTKVQAFAKSRTGQKGDTGASAPLLYLSASAQVMKCNPDNTPQTGQTISIEAKLQNVSGTATFVATPYNDAGTALTAITLGGSGNTRTLTNAQWLATFKRVEVVATLGSLNDKVTIYRVADGATGDAGQNAIVGLLTNESVTLQANSAGAVSSFTPANGEFWVYNGTTKVTSGITFSKVSNTGCTAAITFAGAYSVSAMSADNATVVLRAVYSGVTIDKVLTISKSRAGADGVSITGVDVEFAKNTSPTTAPTTGWATTAPTLLDGEQLWTRTKTTYSSGNPTYSTPANITPKTGATGQGIDSVTEQFILSSSKITQPAEGDVNWSTTPPTWENGKYIWSRVKVVYKNPASTIYTGYAVSSEWEAVNSLQIGGVNLISNLPENWEQGTFGEGNGAFINSGYRIRTKNSIPLNANQKYSFKAHCAFAYYLDIMFYNSVGTYLGFKNAGYAQIESKQFITPSGTSYARLWVGKQPVDTIAINPTNISEFKIKLEEGDKNTTYSESEDDKNSKINAAKLTAEQAQLAADGYIRARYIRDWIKGSTIDNDNVWGEIKVINKNGNNIAANKLPESNGNLINSTHLTDGQLNTFAYVVGTSPASENYVKIDLGQIYYDIDYIQIWHYHLDDITYYGTKTEISTDGVNWTPVFDSAKSGTYKETAAGNIISFRPNEVLAKVLKGAAVTDTFKTTINGGLISTVITEYRELNSEQVTGLISGIQGANKDLPFLVAGGTYAEGIAGTAKAIIRHDGSVKFTEAEVEGEVTAIEGKIGDMSIINGALTSNYSYFTYIGAVYVQVTVIMNLSQSGLTLTSSYGGTADHPQVVTWTCEIGHTFIKVGSMEMRRDGIYRDGTKIL
jgi:hypothetical protein